MEKKLHDKSSGFTEFTGLPCHLQNIERFNRFNFNLISVLPSILPKKGYENPLNDDG